MSQPNILHDFKSSNYDDRNAKISFIILHYTETDNLEKAIYLLTNNKRKVSCHFVIDFKGEIYNLVSENKRAWHAGESGWKNQTDINSKSIGIEIVNAGETSHSSYPEPQINSLVCLVKHLQEKYMILSHNILGHSDIAPMRKIDPGIYFPWEKLNKNKIGLWVKDRICNKSLDIDKYKLLLNNLKKIGYPGTKLSNDNLNNKMIINSFHRHFIPNLLGKVPTQTTLNKTIDLLKIKIS